MKPTPSDILYISNDDAWIDVARDYFENSVTVNRGDRLQEVIEENRSFDLILIDSELEEFHKDGSETLRTIQDLLQEKWEAVCIGLIGDVEGFYAGDSKKADFFISKSNFSDYHDAFEETHRLWNTFMSDLCRPNIRNEWGKLNCVLVHTPGSEVEFAYPNSDFWNYLFDEQMDPDFARRQHQRFIEFLSRRANVLEMRDLLQTVFERADEETRERYLMDVFFSHWREKKFYRLFQDHNSRYESVKTSIIEELCSASASEIVQYIFQGVNNKNLQDFRELPVDYHLPVINEINNALFTRDPSFSINGGFIVNHMAQEVRLRESRVMQLIFSEHPWFNDYPVESMKDDIADRGQTFEGGDVLAVEENKLAIGWSERTNYRTIGSVANVFLNQYDYHQIYLVPIPQKRAYMHLDTVFTRIGENTAVIHPRALDISGQVQIFESEDGQNQGVVRNKKDFESFDAFLSEEFGVNNIIQTAGGDPAAAKKEQWDDASNCVAIAEDEIVTYQRNSRTNEELKKKGVEVHSFVGNELVRGRGGPRCMTMPINRS